jgi:tRNA G46 methylase TrmB
MLTNVFLNGRLKAWWGRARQRRETCAHGGTCADTAVGAVAPRAMDHRGGEKATAFVGDLQAYLSEMENFPEDILKCDKSLSLPRRILEIGCGTADIARDVAIGNPDVCVLATDKYDWRGPCECGSGYRRVALAWREKRLLAQQSAPENMVVLRAEVDLLHHLPRHSLDAVVMINPEPSVGARVLESLATPALYQRLKHGGKILVLPFSRELGTMACGGLEFDHDTDWSRGLGFIMSSSLSFQRGARHHWGVDLGASGYSQNSTQSELYVHVVEHA